MNSKLRATVEFWHLLISLAIIVGGGIYAVASTATEAKSTITVHTTRLDKLEKTSDADHDAITEMRADVKWIRERLSK
jgi:hypothetical protein